MSSIGNGHQPGTERLATQIERLEKALARDGRSRSGITVHTCPGEWFSHDQDTFRKYAELDVGETIVLKAATSCSTDGLLRAPGAPTVASRRPGVRLR